jgi:hypothetical protein
MSYKINNIVGLKYFAIFIQKIINTLLGLFQALFNFCFLTGEITAFALIGGIG